ncbi:MAG TPA: alpha/beta hydrolase [Pyrinomonadaceae bacterium]|nr:alpha/beta hydrolase [Pyrinomonadaceae bacterium]
MLKKFFVNFWSNKNFGWRMARIFALLCAGLAGYVMLFEDSFIYFPSKYPEGIWEREQPRAREGEIVARVEDVQLTAADGVRLHGWFCTPLVGRAGEGSSSGDALEPVKTEHTLLFLHGNAGNISHRYEIIEGLVKLPVNVLVIDYRGYGKSEGSPSEQGLYADARAAWDYLTNVRGIPAARIVIYGESLGGAVAIDLASKVSACGLVVQSSFTSIADMAAEVLPLAPRFLLRTKMDSLSKIAQVSCPKLFIHSEADEIVPYRLGRRLFDAAHAPKQFYDVKNAPHNLTFDIGGAAFYEALRNFVNSSCGG